MVGGSEAKKERRLSLKSTVVRDRRAKAVKYCLQGGELALRNVDGKGVAAEQ